MLANQIWWTRKARIQTEKRLLSNAFQSQTLLLWYSFCSVAASVYYLKFNTSSNFTGVAWVIFSVLVLCVSGFINGLSFKERAGLVKECYETLKTLYHLAKSADDDQAELSNIEKRYEQVLNICENHREIDYFTALWLEHLTSVSKANIDRAPTSYIKFKVILYLFIRCSWLSVLYAFPVLVFGLMEL